MTETTKKIFDCYEVRKTKEQRKSFRAYLTQLAGEYGYEVKEESVPKDACNVIVGDPARAKVIYGAHYDTCAVMPFPNLITPKCFLTYLLYQIVLSVVLFAVPFIIMFVGAPHVLARTESNALYLTTLLGGYALMLVIIYVMMNGPANKHTANDNTSGVTLLIDIMRDLPAESRDDVAFIFFDLEEKGLVGSKGYRQMHKEIAMGKPLINFDCISDGSNILFAVRKKAVHLTEKLEEAFKGNEKYSVHVESKGVFYPSDQRNFDLGVGVSALNKTKHGLLYMDKIHTVKDTVYDEDNVEFLKNGAIRLAKILSDAKSYS